MSARRVTVVSYNVHRCVGLDGRKDVERIASVLAPLRPDVVAIQEAEARTLPVGTTCQLELLGAALGLGVVHGPTIVSHDGRYGNGLLTRFPVTHVQRLDLSFRAREPRGALECALDVDGVAVRFACTHLGLRSAERTWQLARILESMDDARPAVLIGDFNEWRPLSRALSPVAEAFGRAPTPATYPSLRPLVALDRAWVRPRDWLVEVAAVRTPLSRAASDHLPLRAVIEVPAA